MNLSELLKVGIFAIEHEDELLSKLPPEEQAEVILATAKIRQGLEKIRGALGIE